MNEQYRPSNRRSPPPPPPIGAPVVYGSALPPPARPSRSALPRPQMPTRTAGRSRILDASLAYWRWPSTVRRHRRRRVYFRGGCLTWVFIWVAYVIFAAVALVFVAVGGLLSLAGGIDQARIALMQRRNRGSGAP